ncbi:MAG TPA: hypothetical protein VLI69_03160 [Gammaproteobacteria bacterium]|nr:hypothetical protein [Gammaproteobacteria bacterium]
MNKNPLPTSKEDKRKETLYHYVFDHFGIVYREHTRILSNTCRQLALGEGGLCWLLKSFTQGQCISYQVNIVFILLVLFFLFDAAQYLISSTLYKSKISEYNDKIFKGEITNEKDLIEPPHLYQAAITCFIIKFFILIFSSIYLIFLVVKI